MSDELKKLLSSADKEIPAAENVLSRLFRQILADLNINHSVWNKLMIRYLDDPRHGIPKAGRDRSSARGNLNKELRRPTFTWRIFQKGLRFLGPVSVRFEVHMEWPTKKVTVHSTRLKIDGKGLGDVNATASTEEADDNKEE